MRLSDIQLVHALKQLLQGILDSLSKGSWKQSYGQ